MSNFKNLAIEKSKMLTKLKIIDINENISRQQLESIFKTPSTTKSITKPASKPIKPKKNVNSTSVTIYDEFEKS